MTTRPTDEEMDRCERMLTGCTCHTGFSGRGLTDPNCMACNLGSEVIDTFKAMRAELTERQAARDGVTDEMVWEACRAFHATPDRPGSWPHDFEASSSEKYMREMRAALQSVAPMLVSALISDEKLLEGCLIAMQTSQYQQPVSVPDAYTIPAVSKTVTVCSCGKSWEAGSAPDCACRNTQPQPQQAVPDGWMLVPQRFIDLVKAAAHPEVHPRAIPQLIAKAIDALSAAPAYNGKKEG